MISSHRETPSVTICPHWLETIPDAINFSLHSRDWVHFKP